MIGLRTAFRLQSSCGAGFSYLKNSLFRRNKPWILNLRLSSLKVRLHTYGIQSMGAISILYKPGFYIDTNGKQDLNIIDAGAHLGTNLVRLMFHHPRASIVAVEAENHNYTLMKKTFSEFDNVHVMHKAIWNTSHETLYISNPNITEFKHSCNFHSSFQVGSSISAENNYGEVSTISISDILHGKSWDRIDILKLDIEGAEKQIFTHDYDEWLPKVNCLIIEVADQDDPGTLQLVFQSMSHLSLKYNCFISGECLVFIKRELKWRSINVFGFMHGNKSIAYF